MGSVEALVPGDQSPNHHLCSQDVKLILNKDIITGGRKGGGRAVHVLRVDLGVCLIQAEVEFDCDCEQYDNQ